MKKLEEKYGIEWQEFKIDELFEKIPTNKLPYKAKDLKSLNDDIYSLPALTAGIQNQGLAYYVPRDGATILKNVISVSANGANTGVMFYQPKEFTVLQDSYAIKYINKVLKPEHYKYIVAVLQKSIRGRFDWSNKAGWERIKTESITLPINSSGEIAFNFMEIFIKTLEAERIQTLEAYLSATGLNDYKLTKIEKESLAKLESGELKWAEFKMSDLFEKLNMTTKKRPFNKSKDTSTTQNQEFSLPLVNAKIGSNGIMFYGRENEFDSSEMTLDIVSNGAIATGTVYAQVREVGVLWDAYLLKHKAFKLNRELLLFYAATTQKMTRSKYAWENKAVWSKVKNDYIWLPLKIDNTPDFSLMESYIHSIEKIVIKKIDHWVDEKLN
ncbi:restriction endonuclease subunit S [Lentilactobacillus senioris]|uniref:restriction endonuclease subunit S n=1 Tax=Lentilactobacillus senioris TaxID=931534 RepID=UPI003D2B32F8